MVRFHRHNVNIDSNGHGDGDSTCKQALRECLNFFLCGLSPEHQKRSKNRNWRSMLSECTY